MMVNISKLEDLTTFVHRLAEDLVPTPDAATVIGLVGDLGAGKTTFTQLLARELGVLDVVTSPTFLVMRSYGTTHPVFATLVHMDTYRIDDEAELGPLRFAEILMDPHALVVIEWADRIKESLPPTTHYLHFSLTAMGERTIELK